MLPDKLRLKKGDFLLLKKIKGKGFFTDNFSLRVYKQVFTPSRFAVIASQKFFKKSVSRNKAKRIVRSIIQDCSSRIENSFAVLIYINSGASVFLKISFGDIKKELLSVFEKIGLIK